MSNLGLYQTMVTLAKRLGGPGRFMATLVGGGVLFGVAATKSFEKAMEASSAKKEEDAKIVQSMRTYVVNSDGVTNEGLSIHGGDKFKVLERDGNAVLIEILGDENSPYFVAAEFLEGISDYQA